MAEPAANGQPTRPQDLYVQVVLLGSNKHADELHGNLASLAPPAQCHFAPGPAGGMQYDYELGQRRAQRWTVDGKGVMVSVLLGTTMRLLGHSNPDEDVYVHLLPVNSTEFEYQTIVTGMLGRPGSANLLVCVGEGVDRDDWVHSPLEIATLAWNHGAYYIDCTDGFDAKVRDKLLKDAVIIQLKWKELRAKRAAEASARERARAMQETRKQERSRSRFAMMYTAFFSFLYDMFQLAIASMDVITDIWVAVNYYQQGQMTFFWIGIVDIGIAQMCYSAFFVFLYARYPNTWSRKITWFFIVLPFGQLVPLIIYIESHKFKVVSNVFHHFGLEEMHDRHIDPDEDPLMTYLKRKMEAHLGFYLESLVEAIPQSILQMVAIVITGQVSAINVISIAISIISVAAKGLMMSYSIHRPTFIFSFCCIIYDVFSVFTTVGWLFYNPPGDTYPQRGVFYFHGQMNVFTAIWFWKTGILIIMIAFQALNFYLSQLFHEVRFKCCCRRDRYYGMPPGPRRCGYEGELFPMVLAFIGGCFVFLPMMIVLEGVKFAPLPIVVFRSFDSPHARQMPFYGPFFKFLSGGNFRERMFAANQVLCANQIAGSGAAGRYLAYDPATTQDTWMEYIHYSLATPYEKYSLSGLRNSMGVSWKKFKAAYDKMQEEKRRARQRNRQPYQEPYIYGDDGGLKITDTVPVPAERDEGCCEECSTNCKARCLRCRTFCGRVRTECRGADAHQLHEAFMIICGVIIVPLWVIGNLYSLVYPYIRLFTLDWSNAAPMQRGFSFMLLFLNLVQILLLRSVIRFRKSIAYARLQGVGYADTQWLDRIYHHFANVKHYQRQRRLHRGVPTARYTSALPEAQVQVEEPPYTPEQEAAWQEDFPKFVLWANSNRDVGIFNQFQTYEQQFLQGAANYMGGVGGVQQFDIRGMPLTAEDLARIRAEQEAQAHMYDGYGFHRHQRYMPMDLGAGAVAAVDGDAAAAAAAPLVQRRGRPDVRIDVAQNRATTPSGMTPHPDFPHSPTVLGPQAWDLELWHEFGVMPFLNELLSVRPRLAALATPMGAAAALMDPFAAFFNDDDDAAEPEAGTEGVRGADADGMSISDEEDGRPRAGVSGGGRRSGIVMTPPTIIVPGASSPSAAAGVGGCGQVISPRRAARRAEKRPADGEGSADGFSSTDR